MFNNDDRQKLVDGFKQFRQKYYKNQKLMQDLVRNGANSKFFIINCIDPRSGANTIFNADPGQIFATRVMAALVPAYQPGKSDNFAASLKYAIETKKVEHLIIMGHTQCGGIEALVKGTKDNDIAGWVDVAHDAYDRAKLKVGDTDQNALLRETERQAVILGLKNLLSYPVVRDAFVQGKITLNGWLFDMEHGKLMAYDPSKNDFVDLGTGGAGWQHIHRHGHGPKRRWG